MTGLPARPMNSYLEAGTVEGIRIGKIEHIDEEGRVYVDFPGNGQGPMAAGLTASVKERLESKDKSHFPRVLLLFEENDPARPVVIDVLAHSLNIRAGGSEVAFQVDEPKEVTIDGETVMFNAKEQIVLRCGKASITLTKAGKVLIRGAYLLNRSSGVNRIKGASVQIN
jgi:hypothetical protein